MNTLHKYLFPLLACAAVVSAPPATAQWGNDRGNDRNERSDRNDRNDRNGRDDDRDNRGGYNVDRQQLQNWLNTVQNRADREKLQALLNQVQTNGQFDRTKLQALAAQILAAIQKHQNGGSTGGGTTPPTTGGGTTTQPKTLVLYDAPTGTPWDKLGFAYSIMLRNLLGHFDAQVEMMPVQQYTAGKIASVNATFYLGSAYNHTLPVAFLADAAAAAKPVVWFKYNLWQVAGNEAYGFAANTGIGAVTLRGLNSVPSKGNPNPGFFDTVKYKGLDFVKYYNYDHVRNVVNGDPDIGHVTIANPEKASVVVPVANPTTGETAPYVVRSGNFWYVADLPFSFIGPRDRYLVFSDLLHDILGVNHAESHKALIRLEDVGALVSVQAMKDLSNYMAAKKVPFSVAVIPRYVDGLGAYNNGTPQEVHLSQATNLRTSLAYARSKGAEMVMHGFTHQYGKMKNPHTGVSGDDYEFWNIVDNKPFPEDSAEWVRGRLSEGLRDMRAIGLNPIAWEAPHYHTSAITARTAPQLFSTTYQRVVYYTADKPDFWAETGKDFSVGQFFPYVIKKDHYGQYVLPENLGNIEYDISTIDPTSNYNYRAEDLIENARYAKAVRDGFASFFFHPFWLEPTINTPGMADFQKTIEGIQALGYTFVAPSTLR